MEINRKKLFLFGGIFIIVLALVIAGAFIITTKVLDKKDSEVKSSESSYVEYPDLDKYYEENSDIEKIVSVSDSGSVMKEKDVFKELEKRGFFDVSVTYEYDMNGNYSEAQDASKSSSEKHPMYNAIYQSENGNIFSISIINDQFLVTPFSMQLESEAEVGVVISESETITSYDSRDNRYFITRPHDDSMRVKLVEQVDANTLDSLTKEELGL